MVLKSSIRFFDIRSIRGPDGSINSRAISPTDTAIRNAKPIDKPYKLSDAQGLYLLIKPNGSKLWQLKYRFGGKEKKLAFIAYPTVTLANARKLREEARALTVRLSIRWGGMGSFSVGRSAGSSLSR